MDETTDTTAEIDTDAAPSGGLTVNHGQDAAVPTAPPKQPKAGSATPPPPKLEDFSKSYAREVLGLPAKPAKQPAGQGTGPTPDAADPNAAKQPAGADPIADLTALADELGAEQPALAEEIRAIAQPFQRFKDQAAQYYEQLDRSYQALEQEKQRLIAIYQHPAFRQALQGLSQPPRSPAGLPRLDPSQFDTDTERRLYEINLYQQQQIEQMQAALARLEASHEAEAERYTREAETRYRREIEAVHARLDKVYPELAQNAQTRQQWHAKAALLMQAQSAAGQEMDLALALEEAAKILHYGHATAHGARRAMGAATRAARASTPPGAGGSADDGQTPRPGESLAEFGARQMRHAQMA